jgi:hypothetical protein
MRRDEVIKKIEVIISKSVEEVKKEVMKSLEARSPKALMEGEQAIHAACRRLAGELMDPVLGGICSDEAWEESTVESFKAGQIRLRNGGWRKVAVRTLAGNVVELQATYLAPRKKRRGGKKRRNHGSNGPGIYPVLAALGISYRCTPALLSEVARQSVGSSSDEEARINLARLGIEMDIKTVWRITNSLGKDCRKDRDKRLREGTLQPQQDWSDFWVVACVDGGRVRLREPHRKGPIPKGKKRRGFDAKWREPKLLTLYVINAEGKKDPRYPPIIDGTLEDADGVVALLVAYLRSVGVKDASRLIILGDGARWIWNRLQAIVDGVGIDPKQVTPIVDFYHAVEHLQHVVDLKVGWSSAHRTEWFKKQRKLLKQGKVNDVIAAIRPLCKGRNKKEITAELRYFIHNRDHMKYAWYKRRWLPIGSGAIESCIRRVVNLRMKGPGIFWRKENAEGFLHLRCQYKAGRWDEMVLNMLENRDIRLAA